MTEDPSTVFPLDVDRVSKQFGEFHAVSDLTLRLKSGSICGFLGPNGAGKTTTIRMILGILQPNSGHISILGKSSALEVRDRVGYLPEEKGLYKKMKCWAVVAYFASLKGMSRNKARARAYELLETYGLGDFADKPTESLSKGMGQKVQVLASIAHDPEFVILDEPFSGLDPVNQEVMESIIRDMAKGGRTILFSTHIMEHAERLCDRIVLMSQGRKVFDGTVLDAKRQLPRSVLICTTHDVSSLKTLPGVMELRSRDPSQCDKALPIQGQWEVVIAESTDPQSILHHCFMHEIVLNRFQQTEPSLHDVFVHLVGPAGKEASFR